MSLEVTPPDVSFTVVPSLPAPVNQTVLEGGGVDTAYSITTSIVWDMGLGAVPGAGPIADLTPSPGATLNASQPRPCIVFKLHDPIAYKVVRWTAQRIGAKPILPSTNTGSSNEILMGKELGLPTPGATVDGAQTWTVAGQYWYLLIVPPSDSDPLCAGTMPMSVIPSTSNLIQPSDFVDRLLGPVPPVTGQLAEPPEFVGPPTTLG